MTTVCRPHYFFIGQQCRPNNFFIGQQSSNMSTVYTVHCTLVQCVFK